MPQKQKKVASGNTNDAPDAAIIATLDKKVGFHLKRAFSVSNKIFETLFEKIGIAAGQYVVLKVITTYQGLSQKEVARATRIDQSSLVPIIDNFERKGWVGRSVSPRDRRTYLLYPTPAGLETVKAADQLAVQHDKLLMRNVPKGDKDSLIRVLKILSDTEMSLS